MSVTGPVPSPEALPTERLEGLFAELAELAGQRNAIDGRIVEIVAEMDRDELCGATGARSIKALVAWKPASPRAMPRPWSRSHAGSTSFRSVSKDYARAGSRPIRWR